MKSGLKVTNRRGDHWASERYVYPAVQRMVQEQALPWPHRTPGPWATHPEELYSVKPQAYVEIHLSSPNRLFGARINRDGDAI